MPLQTSGPISLNDMHLEAGGDTGTLVSLNDVDIRDMIDKASGVSMNFAEWYGASSDTGVTQMVGGTSADFDHITGTILNSYGGDTGPLYSDPSDFSRAPRWSANEVLDPTTDAIGIQRYTRGDLASYIEIDTGNNRLRCRLPNRVYSDRDNVGVTSYALLSLNRFLPGDYRIYGNGLTPADSNCPSSNTLAIWAYDDSFSTVSPADSLGARELTDATPIKLGQGNVPAGSSNRGFSFTVTSGNQNLVLFVKCYYAPTTQNGVSVACRGGITNIEIVED